VQVTFVSAVVPQDATDPGELFRVADERLLARKRDAKSLARAAQAAAGVRRVTTSW
jgi:hypothetical protein